MKIEITEFPIEAYEAVISLWRLCEGIGLSSADSKYNIRNYLDRNLGMSFIALDDEKVVGAILSGHDGRRGYIHHLAVHPAYRKRGIGKALVEKCLLTLQSVGIQKCHLFIFNDNREGIRFWNEIGWEQRFDISLMSKVIGREGLSESG
jgi:ribosomal protein S18 acetylase RimI-like enzyme